MSDEPPHSARRNAPQPDDGYLTELRLFVEELCYYLCRFQHVVHERIPPEAVRVTQEASLLVG